MRELHVSEVTQVIKELCIKANYYTNKDIEKAITAAKENEISEIGKDILVQIEKNTIIAREKQMPICQDTGMAVVFLDIGQEIHFVGGFIEEAVNEGVRQGYRDGYLRKSVVKDPFFRENTLDNTPAIIHYNIVEGAQLKIDFAPKGFGSENMSQIHMLPPSAGIEGAKRVIIETVDQAGSNACPPMIVGVGIGGTFEKAAYLSKKSLLREVGEHSSLNYVRDLEVELLESINQLGIGPQGLGGRTTALAVHIDVFPTHIAGLPVAVNISCHVTRHAQAIL